MDISYGSLCKISPSCVLSGIDLNVIKLAKSCFASLLHRRDVNTCVGKITSVPPQEYESSETLRVAHNTNE